MEPMDEQICSIELLKEGAAYIVRVDSPKFQNQKVMRSDAFDEVLDQLVTELSDEFEG